MKSEWKVKSVPWDLEQGIKKYYVYRLLDVNEVHHSGNEETYPGDEFDKKKDAQELADKLNQEVKNEI